MKSKIIKEITVTFSNVEAERIRDVLAEFVKGREFDSYSKAADELADILHEF